MVKAEKPTGLAGAVEAAKKRVQAFVGGVHKLSPGKQLEEVAGLDKSGALDDIGAELHGDTLATHVNDLLTQEKFAGVARILQEAGYSKQAVQDYFKAQKLGEQALAIEMDKARREGGWKGALMDLALTDDRSMNAGLPPIQKVTEYMEQELALIRKG